MKPPRKHAFSEAEISAIRAIYPDGGAKACLPHIRPGRNADSVAKLAQRLGIKRNKEWCDTEYDLVRKHFPNGGSKAVKAVLPHRSLEAIKKAAQRIGVVRITAPPTYSRVAKNFEDQPMIQRWVPQEVWVGDIPTTAPPSVFAIADNPLTTNT